jgi:hypothetical protein
MNKIKLLFCLSSCLLLLTNPGFGQIDKIAQSGMKWLSIPVGARASALGSAFTASTPDAGSVFWNPAGVALLHGNSVFVSQTQWIADVDVNAAALSIEAGNLGTFGVHAMVVDWGTFNGTRFTSGAGLFEETGEFSPSDFAIGVTYARQISDKFAFGGNVKFLREDLGSGLEGSFSAPVEYSATLNVLALDFGTIYYTGYKDLRLAMTIRNVSQETKYRFESFPLPLTFRFGMAMDVAKVFMDDDMDQSVTLSIDAVNERDFSERVHFGLEYGFSDLLFLRGGYKTNYDEENITFGGGARVKVSNYAVAVDYGYLQFDNFDAVHMFSLGFGF